MITNKNIGNSSSFSLVKMFLMGLFLSIITYIGYGQYISFANQFEYQVGKTSSGLIRLSNIADSMANRMKSSTGTLILPEAEISSFNLKDLNGKTIAKVVPDFFVSKKTYDVNSPEVISLINIEDNNFFNRETIINAKGFFRAVLNTLRGNKQGGSGITQQIIKNSLLKDEDGMSRKLQELFYTYNLEKKYSKLELVNFYLNNVSYGKNILGIQKAGEVYLGKKELTLEDSFFLNSMLKKPTYYINDVNDLHERAYYYFERYCEFSSCNDLAKSKSYIYGLKIKYDTKNERFGNPFIIDMVLKNKNNIPKYSLDRGEVFINYKEPENETFLRSEILKRTEKVCKSMQTCDIGAMVLNKNGYIEFLHSGDYLKNQVNVLTSDLQPGSTLKPFIYTMYLEKKNIKTTAVSFPNSAVCVNGWCPNNWNDKAGGNVTFQTALDLSLNLPVLHMYLSLGSDSVFNKLSSIGLFDSDEKVSDSFIIGGFPVKPVDLANAYRVFTNSGSYQEFSLFEKKPTVIAYDASKVELMKKILVNNYDYRGKFGLKTGTTNNYKDEYMVAFDKDRVYFVWGGNKDGSPTKWGLFSQPKIKAVMNLLMENFAGKP